MKGALTSRSQRYDLDALPKIQDELVNVRSFNLPVPRAMKNPPKEHTRQTLCGDVKFGVCTQLTRSTMLHTWPAEVKWSPRG